MNLELAPYQDGNLEELYLICLKTGFHGKDASGKYFYPNILGDYFAAPYTFFQPELITLAKDEQGIVGYILGTSDTAKFNLWMNSFWLPKIRPQYRRESVPHGYEDDWLVELIQQDSKNEPTQNQYPAHLHIDLLPRAQGKGLGKKLMNAYLGKLKEMGVSGVQLGVSQQNFGAMEFYLKCGFMRLEGDPHTFVVTL